MDEEKDLFIKSKLQEDKLISKKADEVFENFFNKKMEVESMENQNPVQNSAKGQSKLLKYKKVLAIAACLVVLVGGANVYASTNGFGNIFFLIKYIITGEQPEVNDKDEILSDKDITISYEKINITNKITMQIEKMQIKDGVAKLMVNVDISDNTPNITPLIYKVYDVNDNELCQEESLNLKNDKEAEYTDIITVKNYTDDMKILKLKVCDKDGKELRTIKINLQDRTVEVEEK